tara:strand:+ start:6274 stop:7224 length:951 start_codon:yes stop_codon:yes gene_type:complete
MSIDHVLIVTTDPKSIFLEILFKYFKSKKNILSKKKVTLVGNLNIITKEARKYNYKKKINEVSNISESKINLINIIDIKINKKNKSKNYNAYISNSFNKSIAIIKNNKNIALINGPINKKNFLKKKYLGVTEFLAKKTNAKNPVMLIYNKKISVSPITTHLPLKHVAKNINKSVILNNIISINNFFKDKLGLRAKIAVLGLNPHCETNDKFSEEQKIIIPAINQLKKKKIFVHGPFSADTFFIKKNLYKFDVVVGMYHDQVLTPLKTMFNFNAINITIGLPYIRISPDHGPNLEMYGKNKSDPASIFCAMEFLSKI